MPKNVNGGALLDLLTNIPLQNIKKLKGGTLWGHSHSSEKNPKGGPFGHVRFFIFLEKVKNDRGTLWSTFALGGLGLRCSAQNCKKWTDQCEDCSLKKKKGHCYSRRFFLKRKTRRLKITHLAEKSKTKRATVSSQTFVTLRKSLWNHSFKPTIAWSFGGKYGTIACYGKIVSERAPT